MILVTGATGPLGNAVVHFLVKKIAPSSIGILTRDPAKAADLKALGVDVRQGDYDDPASLVKAFQGIDKLYFVSGTDIVKRGVQHMNVVNAAKEAGVKHVVYTSFQRKNETETSPIAIVAKAHIDTEKALKASGLAYTFMKHNVYMDMLPMFVGEKVLETGTIFLPAGEGKAAYATRVDMAEAGAQVLAGEGHENKVYEISNTESVSYTEIAGILSELSGKEIQYVSPSQEDFKAELTKLGVPEMYIGVNAGFAEAIRQGEFDFPSTDLEKLLGRKPASLKAFLKEAYGF
jgi:NAD(P)H dehydrogenase (quinone)